MNRRAPHAAFHELPLRAIRPDGWLRRGLEIQRDGLTGYLHTTAFPFNTKGWSEPKTKRMARGSWWPYEQVGYWVDGAIRCGHLLRDRRLIAKALKQIRAAVDHPEPDGYIGPPHLRNPVHQNRWPHAVLFRAVMAHASATGQRKYAKAVRRHYLSDSSPHTNNREVCNVEAMLWAYAETGDRRLLKMAVKAYGKFRDEFRPPAVKPTALLSGKRPHCHGVSYMEIAKLPALLYAFTGNRRWLRAAENAFRKLDRFHMLPDGVPSSSEFLAGRSPLDSHETCVIADYAWSSGCLLAATGKASYADRIERACFNAAPGAVRSDFKALQYFSAPNQVFAASNTNPNGFGRGDQLMSYRPNPGVQCCPGDVNRTMPNYVARMWMTSADGGLAAVLYGPCSVTTKIRGREITIAEETTYPFSEQIVFRVRAPKPTRFPLRLRVPAWCPRPQVVINGKKLSVKPDTDGFVRIERTFRDGDCVVLSLPMKIRTVRWPGGGIVIERGPLVYALKIKEKWTRVADKRSTAYLPSWDLHPASPWNYALVPGEPIEVRARAVSDAPWDIRTAPIELRAAARRVPGWKPVKRKVVKRGYPWGRQETVRGNFLFTPPLPRGGKARASGPTRNVALIPYGCAKLRVTVFPVAGKR